jgi:hypothetical protein
MFCELVTHTASPLKKIIPVSVTMNGGIRNPTTATPFNPPITAPTPTIASTPTGTASGCPASHPCSPLITAAPNTLATAIIEVTDKSIPPVIITAVCPIATM